MQRTHYDDPGPAVEPGGWFLRSYLRGLAALGISFVVAFWTFRQLLTSTPITRRPPFVPPEVLIRRHVELVSESVGFDISAPVHDQFIAFVITRVTHPLVAVPVVAGAVVAIVLAWRNR